MNKHEEIKKLLEASRKMLLDESSQEQIQEIKKNHGLILEDDSPLGVGNDVTKRDDITKSVEDKITFTVNPKDEKSQSYRISGGVITLHGKDKQNLELTTDEKAAFQETMDEFVAEVSELTDFGKLNVYTNNVQWSGHIVDLDIDFIFSINETSGLYIKGNMIKVDQDFSTTLSKLQAYYQKFRTKWAKIIASRKKTKEK